MSMDLARTAWLALAMLIAAMVVPQQMLLGSGCACDAAQGIAMVHADADSATAMTTASACDRSASSACCAPPRADEHDRERTPQPVESPCGPDGCDCPMPCCAAVKTLAACRDGQAFSIRARPAAFVALRNDRLAPLDLVRSLLRPPRA
jgi:hypothetical protein